MNLRQQLACAIAIFGLVTLLAVLLGQAEMSCGPGDVLAHATQSSVCVAEGHGAPSGPVVKP